MNKSVLIAIAAIVVVGGGAYVFLQGGTPAEEHGTAMEQMHEDSMSEKTLRALLESGKSLTCTYSKTDEHGTQEGTAYIDHERVRADFQIALGDAAPYDAHAIIDGDWIYTWGGPLGEKEGLKMKATKDDDTEKSGDEPFDVDEEADFHCESWKVDEKKFDPPQDVTFTEFSMQAQMEASIKEANIPVDCSICDNVPEGEGRTQCRAALGC